MNTHNYRIAALLFTALLSLAACTPGPEKVAESWLLALNQGNVDAALGFLADDADVTIVPPGPDGDGVYHGHAEIRGWYEGIAAGKGSSSLSNCRVSGETITCLNTYADEGLKAMGVDFIEGEWVATVRDGKIQAYTSTISPASLAKFPSPEPTAEPTIQPTAEPVAAQPVEQRLRSADGLLGKWDAKYGESIILHEFRRNGTVVVTLQEGRQQIAVDRYWFEDELLKIGDTAGNSGGDCPGMVGSYELYATYQGEQVTQLRFVLVGDDLCASRKQTLTGEPLAPSQ